MAREPELNEDFRDMLAALDGAGVEFLIVGAHALAVHGIVRATGDLDVLVRPSAENAARVVRALRAFGAPLEAHHVTEADFAAAGTVYQIGLPPRRIDLLTEISGVAFDDAWSHSVTSLVEGRAVRFLGRDELIRNKRAAARDKDLVDVAALERLKG